ncbi:MAG: gliding motility-associated C-terminal domain-containing protein [Flavobacteriales bacterium]|nr:gliding motility-associated C-terminal domain-containing protein [Flavobacteriales bacterium]
MNRSGLTLLSSIASATLLLCATMAQAQTREHGGQARYWVGGSGNWENADHWSLQANGVGGAGAPGSNDNAVIDPSGAVAVSIPLDAECKSLLVVGDNGPVTIAGLSGSTLRIGGDWTLNGDVIWQHPGSVLLNAREGEHALATGAVMIHSDVITGGDATWYMTGALVIADDRSLILRKGTLRTNDRVMQVGKLCSEGRGAKRLEAGGAIIMAKVFEAGSFKADVDGGSPGLLVAGEATDWDGRLVDAEQMLRSAVNCGTGAGQTPFQVVASCTSNFNGFCVSCNDACDGAVTVTINGGVSPFNIQWQGGPNTPNWSGLCAGNRLVVVTDLGQGVGCFASVNVTEPPPISVLFFGLNPPSCANSCNGSAITFPGGGAGDPNNFAYNWNGGVETSPNPTQLCAGVNTLTITDENNCVFDTTFTLNVQPIAVVPSSTNATCFGDCDGTASVVVTGGTGTIDYDWTPDPPPGGGEGTPNASLLCAGNWSVLISDDNGCDTTVAFVITEPLPIVPNVTATPATCANNCDGTATAAPTGGLGTYDFLWTPGGQTTATATGLCPGNYTVLITDQPSGCDTLVPVVITAPLPIIPNLTITDASCSDVCNGTVVCFPQGGTGAYTFLWAPGAIIGQGTPTASNLCPGNYTVLITDAAGCDTLVPFTINAPPAIVPDTSWTDVTCAGLCDGTANAPAVGGTGLLIYVWSPAVAGQGTPFATQLCAGNYSVTISDVNGCDTTVTFTIAEPPPITAVPTITNASCNGTCDGAADVLVSGGTGTLQYVWAPQPGAGQGTPNASQMCPGNYTLTVTDANDCELVVPITIAEPPPFVVTLTVTPASCSNACDGAVDAVVTGGTPLYDFIWTPAPTLGQGTANASGFCPGPGTVLITDDAGCDTLINFIILAPTPILPNETVTNVTCNDGNDGSIITNPTGGSGAAFTFLWAPPPPAGQGTNAATGLTAGTWSVTISDGSCDTTLTVVITEPPPFDISSTVTDATCNGDCDGAIDVLATGGVGVLDYVWSPAVAGQGTPNASLLCAGNYSLTITDDAGCDTTLAFVILEAPPLTPALTTTTASCGVCDGTATIDSVPGAVGTITYDWQPPPGLGQGTANATDFCPGPYTVTITDGNGCDTTLAFVINTPSGITAVTSQSNESCAGACDGTASAIAGGGLPGYTYDWSPPPPTGQGTDTASDLCPGTWNLTISDAAQCDTTIVFIITGPLPILPNETFTNETCNGPCDGTAAVNPAGGSGVGFTVLWNPGGQTTPSISGLCAGIYTATILDDTGCDTTVTITILPEQPVSASITVTNGLCHGECNGAVLVTASGGTGPYSYFWTPVPQNGQGDSTATGLCEGGGNVIVTDANGCDTTLFFDIFKPGPIIPNLVVEPEDCSGACSGQAAVFPFGGTGSFTYDWQPGGLTTNVVTGLCAGNYTVTVTDSVGCDTLVAFTVDPFSPIIPNFSTTPETCVGSCDGTLTFGPTGGEFPYTYFWDPVPPNGQNVQQGTGLCAGVYNVTITDASGCDTTASALITGPQPFDLNATVTNVLCNGDCNGSVVLFPTGGTQPYTYTWSPIPPNGQGLPIATDLCPGTITVTVADDNGCDTTVTFTITEPLPLAANGSSTESQCQLCNGTATVAPSGGTTPYLIVWTDANLNLVGFGTTVTNLCAGVYTASIADSAGCFLQQAVPVTDSDGEVLTVVGGITSCPNTCDGTVEVQVNCSDPLCVIAWFNSNGLPLFQNGNTVSGLCAGDYLVQVTNASGCVSIDTVTVTTPSPIIANISTTPVTCAGDSTGTATSGPTGGVPGYGFNWGPDPITGDGTPQVTGLAAGVYTLNITDFSGCDTTYTFLITEPLPITVNAVQTDLLCAGDCNASIVVTPNGGTGLFTFDWNPAPPNGDGTNGAFQLCAGSYDLTITDANGCDTTVTYVIADPQPITLSVASTPSTCLICNGTATATTGGGTGSIVVTWTLSGAPVGNGASLTNLCAGVYTATATDDNGCSTSTAVVITDSNGEVLTIIDGATGCAGECSGIAQVQFICTVPSCSIEWFDMLGNNLNQSGQISVDSLCAGSYIVLVTNGDGCTSADTATIVEPNGITPNISSTPATCAGACDGTATSGPVGGVPGYTFDWGPDPITGDSTTQVTGLCAGVYTLTITDANGCDTTATVLITEPQPIGISATVEDASCNGFCDGSIIATVLGGTGLYTYDWNPDPPNGDGTGIAIQLCPGTYDLTVTDDNGCDTTVTYTIDEPQLIVLSSASTQSQCLICNGTAAVIPVGGTAPYTYDWTLAGAFFSTDSALVNLCAGLYSVTVTDANGCAAALLVPITDSNGEVLTTIDGLTTCPNTCDGVAQVLFNCGVIPCSIAWYDILGTTLNEPNTFNVDSLCVGSYLVQVINGDGCMTIDTVNVTSPDPIVPNLSSTPLLCNNECIGTATAGPTGGTGVYTYDWSPDPLVGDSTAQITQLCAGVYTVFISDGLCDTTASVLIIEPAPYNITATIDSASCFGTCDGSIDLVIQGATGPYVIDWSPDPINGDGTPTVIDLCAGTYTATITDLNGCDTVLTYVVNEPAPLSGTVATTDNACFGACQGTAAVQVVGGTAPYTITWALNGIVFATDTLIVDSLCAGDYTMTVVDAHACVTIANFTLDEGPAILPTLTFIGETCNGPGDGEAHVAPTGGSGTLTYNWDPDPSNPDGTVDAFGLVAGNYTITITDSLGCDTVVPFTIIPFQPILPNAAITQVLCAGDCNGLITLGTTGGFGNYTYDWTPDPQNGDGTNVASGLCAGNISVLITDQLGCDTTVTFTITEPTELTVTVDQVVDALCSTANDGSIAITVAGGTLNYGFIWNGPNGYSSTDEDIAALAPGVYTVTITDANGCQVSASATVNATITLDADAGPDVNACNGDQIVLDGSTSIGATSYTWTDAQNNIVGTNAQYTLPTLTPGTYTYTLSISNGPCDDSEQVVVTILGSPGADAGPDVSIFLQQTVVIGGNPTGPAGSSYIWQPDSLLDDASLANPIADPPSTTWFVVTVTSPNGCTSIDSVLVTVIPEIVIPTGFSPNGDGVNDGWQIDLIERFPDCTVEIYNRWGELLFASVGYAEQWDGTYNGGEVPIGTYYYAIELNDPDFPEPYTGPLTVLR